MSAPIPAPAMVFAVRSPLAAFFERGARSTPFAARTLRVEPSRFDRLHEMQAA